MPNATFDLESRIMLITGAGQGVGRATALASAEAGAVVIVNDYHSDRAEEVCSEIKVAGGEAYAVGCDVTDYDAVAAMVDQVNREVGVIDVLVNNAGNAGTSTDNLFANIPFWETEPDEWARWINVNFFGVLNVSRAVVPGMVTNKFGKIVNIISDAARVGEPHLVVYGGAKAGAAGFSRGLAKAVGRHGITVNCVSLGSIKTPTVAEITEDPIAVKRLLSQYVIRRLGEPDDAVNMILFLASEASSWITGQTYPVNGGYTFAV